MLRLEMFGGLSLTQADSAAPSQKRRLAFLSLLALAGERGMSREKLAGYLWPDSSPEDARHSLEQLVYATRRALGDSLISGGNPTSLDFDCITTDVGDFERALSDGDYAAAVRLYRGEFLDGFSLNDSAEFERWQSAEARRLSGLQAKALEAVARQASADGDHSLAIESLRARAALDPLSARGALLLMRAFAESGDRASALRHAAVYEELLRQELDSKPDPEITAFSAELREGARQKSDGKNSVPVPRPAPQQSVDALASASPAPISRLAPAKPRQGSRTAAIAVAVIVISLLIAVILKTRGTAEERESSRTTERIAVLPFRVAARDSALNYLGEGMADLLSSAFTGEGGPAAIEPRTVLSAWRKTGGASTSPESRVRDIARSVRAGEVLTGEIVQTAPGRLVITGRVISMASGRVLTQEVVQGAADSVAILSERLAARLLAARSGEETQRLPSLFISANNALTPFLQGRSEYRRGNIAAARREFGRALDRDSTFAPAALQLALATGRLFQWNSVTTDTVRRVRAIAGPGTEAGRSDEWERGIRLAIHDSARLSSRDRAVLAALRGDYPDPTPASTVLGNWERAAELSPESPDVQFWLGQVLLTQGFALGLNDSRQRAAAAFRRAFEMDSGFVRPLEGLIEIAAFDRDLQSLDRLARLYLANDSSSAEAGYVKWRVAATKGDEAALGEIRPRLHSLPTPVLDRIRVISQLDGVALADAANAISIISGRAGARRDRQLSLHHARQLALNEGRPLAAVQIGIAKKEVEPNADLQRGYAIRDALYWEGDTAVAKTAVTAFEADLEKRVHAGGLPDDRRAAYWRFSAALWRISHGDTSRVAGDIARLRGTGSRNEQARMLDALLAFSTHRSDAAQSLARLDSLALLGFGTTPHGINLVCAQLHERKGDVAGALAAIRRGIWYFPPENLSTYLKEEARLSILTKDYAGARRALRQYLTLRSNPEPRARAEVVRLRTTLEQLEKDR